MTTAIRRRRGTTAQHSTFIGLDGETTIDTDKEVVVVHDGTTQGGFPLMRENGSNSALALGSAGTPSLKFTGDTNTGIYSPGADQVAISTNGTQRLNISSTGSLVATSTSALVASFSGPANAYVDITDGTGIFRTQLSAGNTFIGSATNHSLIFTTNNTERMRLDSSGRLGLGTSSPSAKAEIVSSGSESSLILRNASGTASTYSELKFAPFIGTTAAAASIRSEYYATNASTLAFRTTNTNAEPVTRLFIGDGGNVGIGTTSPLSPLHVRGGSVIAQSASTASATVSFYAEAADAAGTVNAPVNLVAATHGATGQGGSQFYVETRIPGGGLTRALTIDSSQRVGIGTTSPTFAASYTGLHLDGGANGPVVRLTNSTTGSTATDGFDIILQQGGSDAYIWQRESASIILGTAATERARIDSSGRLLVGTSTTGGRVDARFQIAGSTTAYLFEQRYADNNASGADLFLTKSRGSVASPAVVSNGDNISIIRFSAFDGTNYDEAASIAAAVDGTPGTNDMPGRLVFSTTADGASSPTERMRLTSTGYAKFSTNGTYQSTDCHQFYQSNTNNFGLLVGGFGAYANTVLALQGTNATSTAFNLIEGYYGGNQVSGIGASIAFRVRGDGNVTNVNNSYGAISDIKLKENIVDAGSQWSDLKALQVRKYNFKEGQTHTQIGLVAQEVELVSPGLVSESPDRDEDGNDLGTVTKSVNYSVLYMKAVKALQEAMERIESLEAKVAALEAS
jgi:hypothetical protein